ncbi:glutamate racemase [uncultured Brachyspira sp.]|uniref:glutamate racemase n=3 Tax=uncultured Brachyspira sp. TaxID=221953 RepID=UPI0025D895BD|nr:glutamate racemase [uncultured Brachyspira sp.]
MSIISDISNMPIGVFDSGFGGLTVLKQLLKILPNENYIYLGDNINIPYGDKTKEEIEKLTFKMADFLINQKCKMLVIACNTISACSYSILKDKYQIPIIEVISNGVKDALNNTKNNNIYIIGTEFTIQSNAYKNEINKYNKINKNNKVKITQLACRKLCPMIENDWSSYDNRLEVLNSYLENIDENSDTLILACTHYTHILDDIKNLLQNNIKNNIKNIIDPAYYTAASVKQYLEKNNLLNNNNNNIKIYTTENIQKANRIIDIFLPKEIYNNYAIKHLNL